MAYLGAMPTYFFDMHQCSGVVTRDQAGREAADPAAAREIAIAMARAYMAEEVGRGCLCLSCWIVVTNEQGHHVLTLQFGEAIQLRPPHRHDPDEVEREFAE